MARDSRAELPADGPLDGQVVPVDDDQDELLVTMTGRAVEPQPPDAPCATFERGRDGCLRVERARKVLTEARGTQTQNRFDSQSSQAKPSQASQADSTAVADGDAPSRRVAVGFVEWDGRCRTRLRSEPLDHNWRRYRRGYTDCRSGRSGDAAGRLCCASSVDGQRWSARDGTGNAPECREQ
jgi:hypothetical protein